MKLRIYRSDKGDCLLATGDSGGNILVDGGMRSAFVEHVRDDLGRLAAARGKLDLVCISHIDQDHIAGIVELLDSVMAWRVFDFRSRNGAKVKPPKFPKMPAIGEIWHNAFSAQVGELDRPVTQLLAQSAKVLGLSSNARQLAIAARNHELANSVGEAIQVSRRVAADQLAIPLNRQFDGKLVLVRDAGRNEAKVGRMKLLVIGPFKQDVEALREEWRDWLDGNKAKIASLKKAAEADARSIGNAAANLSELLAARVERLGNRAAVTAPNLASIMLLVEEGRKKVLLTGDGHSTDIVKGLKHHGKLDANGRLHVDVLKVQHHGAAANIDEAFCREITADHYVFCGNGKHTNPELKVLDTLCKERLAARPGAFTLWFNCDPRVAPSGSARTHMNKVKKQVDAAIAASRGRIKAKYLSGSSFDLAV